MEGSGHATQVPGRVPCPRCCLGAVRSDGHEDSRGSGVTNSCLYGWAKQDRIDRDEIEGVFRAESRELRKAKRRLRELEDC